MRSSACINYIIACAFACACALRLVAITKFNFEGLFRLSTKITRHTVDTRMYMYVIISLAPGSPTQEAFRVGEPGARLCDFYTVIVLYDIVLKSSVVSTLVSNPDPSLFHSAGCIASPARAGDAIHPAHVMSYDLDKMALCTVLDSLKKTFYVAIDTRKWAWFDP